MALYNKNSIYIIISFGKTNINAFRSMYHHTGKKNTYNDVSLERLSRECGTEQINLSLDEPLEEKIEE
jgi:hypothetical protein